MKNWILSVSLILNFIFLIGWGLSTINTPSYKEGRLEKDIEIGFFTGDSVLFTLPKGLTVRNVSQRGIAAIGQFENERFEIVITSDDCNLVNYDLPDDSLNTFSNLYSAEIKEYK